MDGWRLYVHCVWYGLTNTRVLQTSHVCGCTNHMQDTYKASPALFYVSSDAVNRAKVYQGQLYTEDASCLTSAYLQSC
jgi:hypothetical protein